MFSDISSSVIRTNSVNNEDDVDADEFEKNDENVNEKILTHSKFDDSLNSKKSIESEYLKTRKWYAQWRK